MPGSWGEGDLNRRTYTFAESSAPLKLCAWGVSNSAKHDVPITYGLSFSQMDDVNADLGLLKSKNTIRAGLQALGTLKRRYVRCTGGVGDTCCFAAIAQTLRAQNFPAQILRRGEFIFLRIPQF